MVERRHCPSRRFLGDEIRPRSQRRGEGCRRGGGCHAAGEGSTAANIQRPTASVLLPRNEAKSCLHAGANQRDDELRHARRGRRNQRHRRGGGIQSGVNKECRGLHGCIGRGSQRTRPLTRQHGSRSRGAGRDGRKGAQPRRRERLGWFVRRGHRCHAQVHGHPEPRHQHADRGGKIRMAPKYEPDHRHALGRSKYRDDRVQDGQ